jgi:hypothetical protein
MRTSNRVLYYQIRFYTATSVNLETLYVNLQLL